MSVVYRWLNNDKSIMSFIFQVDSTWDDFYDVSYLAFDQTRSVHHAVDTVLDLSRMVKFPRETIKELYYLTQFEHLNTRHRVIISQNPMMHEIYRAFHRSYPIPSQSLMLCHTMEEAHFILSQLAPPAY